MERIERISFAGQDARPTREAAMVNGLNAWTPCRPVSGRPSERIKLIAADKVTVNSPPCPADLRFPLSHGEKGETDEIMLSLTLSSFLSRRGRGHPFFPPQMVRPFGGSTLLTALSPSKGKLMVLSEVEAQAHHKWKGIKGRVTNSHIAQYRTLDETVSEITHSTAVSHLWFT
jgi:hypothetical protein